MPLLSVLSRLKAVTSPLRVQEEQSTRRIVGLAIVRNEQDVVEPFVRHNLELLDAIVIVDHDSVDNTGAILRELASETGRISVAKLQGFAFDQARITTALLHLVQPVLRADFALPLDADEFLRCRDRATAVAAFELIPPGDAGLIPWQTLLLPARPNGRRPDPPRSLAWRRERENPRFRKVVLRLDGGDAAPWSVETGNHVVRHAAKGAVPQHDLPNVWLAHAPIRSREQIAAKAALGWLARLVAQPDARTTEYHVQTRQLFDALAAGETMSDRALHELCLGYAQDSPATAVPDRHGWRYRRSLSSGEPLPAVALMARAWERAIVEPTGGPDLRAAAFDPPLEDLAARLPPQSQTRFADGLLRATLPTPRGDTSMSRLQLGQKALVIAMDHARTLGVPPGLEKPGEVLDRVIEAGADAVMTSYGVIKHYRDRLIGRVPTYLRLDGGPSIFLEDWLRFSDWRLLHTVEDARRLGVDGVCLMGFLGAKVEMDTYSIVGRVVGDCAADGLPVMVEALPCPTDRIPDTMDAGAMAAASRIAFELGADIVKTYYTGSAASFRQVTETCPVPVLIAGGTRMDTTRAALEVVHGSIAGGGRGVVFGRNIWQNKQPGAVVRAMKAIIHDGADVAGAMDLAGLRE